MCCSVVAVANLFGIFDFSPKTGFAQEYDSSSNSLTIKPVTQSDPRFKDTLSSSDEERRFK